MNLNVFKIGGVSNGGYEQPVKLFFPEITPVEFVTELIEIVL
jgi:hypothetical protein